MIEIKFNKYFDKKNKILRNEKQLDSEVLV